MTDLTGFIQQCDNHGRALVLQQIQEPGTTFPRSDEAYDTGNPFTRVTYPETVRNGLTRTGEFQIASPVVLALRTRVLFDTAPSVHAGYVAVNLRAI